VGTFKAGNSVLAWLKVTVKFILIRGWRNVLAYGVDEGPEVVGMFKGPLEELLDAWCKVSIIFCKEKLTEAMKILKFVEVKDASHVVYSFP
jgi:hypothetical protein